MVQVLLILYWHLGYLNRSLHSASSLLYTAQLHHCSWMSASQLHRHSDLLMTTSNFKQMAAILPDTFSTHRDKCDILNVCEWWVKSGEHNCGPAFFSLLCSSVQPLSRSEFWNSVIKQNTQAHKLTWVTASHWELHEGPLNHNFLSASVVIFFALISHFIIFICLHFNWVPME